MRSRRHFSLVFPVYYAVTINLQVSYLRPVLEGRFRAEGKCIKAGKKVLFCEAAVYDNRDELVCTAVSQLLAVAGARVFEERRSWKPPN